MNSVFRSQEVTGALLAAAAARESLVDQMTAVMPAYASLTGQLHETWKTGSSTIELLRIEAERYVVEQAVSGLFVATAWIPHLLFPTDIFGAADAIDSALFEELVTKFIEENENEILEELEKNPIRKLCGNEIADAYIQTIKTYRAGFYFPVPTAIFSLIERVLREQTRAEGARFTDAKSLFATYVEDCSTISFYRCQALIRLLDQVFYAQCRTDEQVSKLDRALSRHALTHGRVINFSKKNSLNALLLFDLLMVILADRPEMDSGGNVVH